MKLASKPSDLDDALQHVLGEVLGCDVWPAGVWVEVKPMSFSVPRLLEDLQSSDPYEDWGGYQPGELRRLDRSELVEELGRYRRWGTRALGWLDRKIPPIFVLRDPEYGTVVADGRGRVSLAVGLGLGELEGYELTLIRS